jgi:hypothetical protein
MRSSFRALAATATFVLLLAGAADAKTTQSRLTALSGSGTGSVEVSPTSKDDGALTFDVQGTVNIHDATPNTAFTVLRRVDLNPDGTCTGATWLTLPGSPVLMTSAGGAGALHFEIQRGAPFVDDVRFDVIWRVTGSDGTILESDCLTVTVK